MEMYKIGDEVMYSQLGLQRLSKFKKKNRIGVIKGFTKNKECAKVVWFGTSTPSSIHKDYIKLSTL